MNLKSVRLLRKPMQHGSTNKQSTEFILGHCRYRELPACERFCREPGYIQGKLIFHAGEMPPKLLLEVPGTMVVLTKDCLPPSVI